MVVGMRLSEKSRTMSKKPSKRTETVFISIPLESMVGNFRLVNVECTNLK